MALETDKLLLERNSAVKDMEGGNYFSTESATRSEPPLSPAGKAWATFKRVLPGCLNIFTFFLAGIYLLKISYSTDLGEHWYTNFLMPYALICYAFGTVFGVLLKFTEGTLLCKYFPKKCGHRKFSYDDLQDLAKDGFWTQYLIIFCLCVYVELTASIVGKTYAMNDVFVKEYPGVRLFTLSWFTVEPSSVVVFLLFCVLCVPMWHKTKLDLTWFGLSPLFIANNFPWGFPVYRIMVGTFSIHTKLNEMQKERQQARAAAQNHFIG